MRILALGVINRPGTHLTVNRNAHAFLYPPKLEPPGTSVDGDGLTSHPNASDPRTSGTSLNCRQFDLETESLFATVAKHLNTAYRRLSCPMPSYTHSNYPMYTPGGGDQRWHPDAILEGGMQWAGGLMYARRVPLFTFD